MNIPITNTIRKAVEQGAFTHAGPRGGEQEAFRLGDWKGYNQASLPFLHLEKEGDNTYELNIAYEKWINFNIIFEGDTHSGVDYRDMSVFDESTNTPYFWYSETYYEDPETGEPEDIMAGSYIDPYTVFLPQGMTPGIAHNFLLGFSEDIVKWHDTVYVYFGMYNKGTNSALPIPYTIGIPGVPQYGYRAKIKLKNVQDRVLYWNFYMMVATAPNGEALSYAQFTNGNNSGSYLYLFDSSDILIIIEIYNDKTYPIYPERATLKVFTNSGYADVNATYNGVSGTAIEPGKKGVGQYRSTAGNLMVQPPLAGVKGRTMRIYYEGSAQGEATVWYTLFRG